jgi:hypothetical protein
VTIRGVASEIRSGLCIRAATRASASKPLTDAAASYMTGSQIVVDGGRLLA